MEKEVEAEEISKIARLKGESLGDLKHQIEKENLNENFKKKIQFAFLK